MHCKAKSLYSNFIFQYILSRLDLNNATWHEISKIVFNKNIKKERHKQCTFSSSFGTSETLYSNLLCSDHDVKIVFAYVMHIIYKISFLLLTLPYFMRRL